VTDRLPPSWQTLGAEPPAPGASRADRLAFARSMILRMQVIGLPGLILGCLLIDEAWFRWLVIATTALAWLDLAYLTWKIRRLRSRGG